ncbi:hypothetical protein [Tenacibaculum amylolyticum]|uniref:hypothetical protein n=1 Tax=Tenacibaculum amylolyticum TaxID=104269 RepID=UPI003895FD3C
MSDATKTKFSTAVIAITGLISAIGGVITILYNVGFLGPNKEQKPEQKKTEEKVIVVDKEKAKPTKTIVDKPEEKTKIIDDFKPKKVVEKEVKKEYNLTGYWLDVNNANGKYYIDHNTSGRISFTEYSFVFGEWIVTANGTGTIKNGRIEIPYTTYVGTNGEFTGKLVEENHEIQGNIHDLNANMKAVLNLQKEQ